MLRRSLGDPDIDVIRLCAASVYGPRNRRIDPRSRPCDKKVRTSFCTCPPASNRRNPITSVPTDETSGKSTYDATRITSSYDAATPHMPLVTRDHIEYFVDRYFLNRTLFKLGAGKPDDQLALLKQLSSSPLKT